MIKEFSGEYEFLSNFYESPMEIDGIVYPTVEHYFQAMKTLNEDEAREIAAAPTPGKAKHLGRKVHLRGDWENCKDRYMYIGLKEKFKNPELRAKLLATGDQPLEEGNWWHDQVWGSCNCPIHQEIPGDNRLGKLLMKLREEINKGEID